MGQLEYYPLPKPIPLPDEATLIAVGTDLRAGEQQLYILYNTYSPNEADELRVYMESIRLGLMVRIHVDKTTLVHCNQLEA